MRMPTTIRSFRSASDPISIDPHSPATVSCSPERGSISPEPRSTPTSPESTAATPQSLDVLPVTPGRARPRLHSAFVARIQGTPLQVVIFSGAVLLVLVLATLEARGDTQRPPSQLARPVWEALRFD